MKKNVLITFLLFLCIPVFAQKKDTLKLSVVEIREKQYVWMNGLRVSRIEMSALQKNDQATLAEVLQTNTPVFIKSYGQGGLSTVSLRGAGASHTQVLWNGLRINSPMLGQVDLSQQPVFFIDEITLVHGASDMAYGTATAGGSLLMKNRADWSLPLRVQVSAGGGSFSALNGSALVRVTQDQTQFCTRIQHTLAENNFTYHDNSVTKPWPLKTRTDAAFSQTSVMQEIYTNLSSNKQLSFQLWGEQQNREIPSSLLVTQPEGNESQTTSFLRSVLQFKNSTGKGMFTAMFGGAAEDMNYINKVSSIDSKNRSYNFTSQFSYARTLKDNLSVFGIVRTETDDVESVNYSSHPERTIANVSAGVRKFFGYAFQTSFCTRAFFSSQKILPFVPTLSANWRLFRKSNVFIRGSWSGIARYPTLNDLYWNPGGNPDLKPETGNTRDAGISFAKPFTKNKHWLQFETGMWQSSIHDFIQWLPSDSTSWWMPQGVKDVSTKGYDASLSLTLKLGRYSLYGKCGYQHTESKVTGTQNSNDNTLGKQLIYIPMHSFNGNLKIKRGNWTLEYFYQYTGKRFTTADNMRYMPPFMLNSISLGRVISLKDGSLTFQASCYNLLNADYQVIAWQPMPGRNFNFSVKYNYNKPK